MEPFRQKGYSMASWTTFIFKSVMAISLRNFCEVLVLCTSKYVHVNYPLTKLYLVSSCKKTVILTLYSDETMVPCAFKKNIFIGLL